MDCRPDRSTAPYFRFNPMNKKQKKQLDIEHKKLAQLQQQLAGAKKQLDDPDEVRRLEREIAATNERIEKIKQQA